MSYQDKKKKHRHSSARTLLWPASKVHGAHKKASFAVLFLLLTVAMMLHTNKLTPEKQYQSVDTSDTKQLERPTIVLYTIALWLCLYEQVPRQGYLAVSPAFLQLILSHLDALWMFLVIGVSSYSLI